MILSIYLYISYIVRVIDASELKFEDLCPQDVKYSVNTFVLFTFLK